MKVSFLPFVAIMATIALLNGVVSAAAGGLRKNNELNNNNGAGESRALVAIQDHRNLFEDWDPIAGRWLEVSSSKDVVLGVPSSIRGLSKVHRELFFKWAKKAWKKTKEAAVKVVKKVVEVVETSKKVVKVAIDKAKEVVGTVKDTVKCASSAIKDGNHIGIVGCAIEGTTKVIGQVQQAIEENKPLLNELVDGVKETIETAKDAVEDVTDIIEEATNEAKEDIEDIADDAEDVVEEAKEDATEIIKAGDKMLQNAVDVIKQTKVLAKEAGDVGSDEATMADANDATNFIDQEIDRAQQRLTEADGEEKRLLQKLLKLDARADKLEEKAMADPGNEKLMQKAEAAAKRVEAFAKKVTKKLRKTNKKLAAAELGAKKALRDAVKTEQSIIDKNARRAKFMVASSSSKQGSQQHKTFNSLNEAKKACLQAEEPKMIVKKKAGVVIPIKGSYIGPMKKCDPRKKVICRGGRLETIKGLIKAARGAFRKQDQEDEPEGRTDMDLDDTSSDESEEDMSEEESSGDEEEDMIKEESSDDEDDEEEGGDQ